MLKAHGSKFRKKIIFFGGVDMNANLLIRVVSVIKSIYWLILAILYHTIKILHYWSSPSKLLWSRNYIKRHKRKCKLHDGVVNILSTTSGMIVVICFLALAENTFEDGFRETIVAMLPVLAPSVIYLIFSIDNHRELEE